MYYGYIRVSTQTQAREGYGLETQKDKIIERAAAEGWTIGNIFEDAGISGTDPNRPGLSDLVTVLRPGDFVVVLNTSRLWRSDTAKVLIRRELKEAGADVISIEQPTYSIYTSEPNDFLVNSLFEVLDSYDRMQISQKLAAGRATRATTGKKPCGLAAYGYMWVNKNIVPDPVEAPIFKKLYSISMLKGFAAAEKYAAENGYKNRNGKPFTRQAIRYMINNPFYKGLIVYNGKEYRGTHTALID